MVPVGSPIPLLVTVAVNTIGLSVIAGFALDANAIEVNCFTEKVRGVELDAPMLLSPA
jgi:hypothetical protein